jgi:hypothetical protein
VQSWHAEDEFPLNPGQAAASVSSSAGAALAAGNVLAVGRGAQAAELVVHAGGGGRVEGVADPVADPLHRGDVAGDGAGVVGGGVDQELACPQAEPGEVDLDHGPVLELEVEVVLGDPQGGRAGLGGPVGGERADVPAHLRDELVGHAARPP